MFIFSLFSCLQTNGVLASACFPQCSEAQKLLNIATELLHTEEAYVKRLNLLDQVTLCLGMRLRVRECVFWMPVVQISISRMCQRS